MPNTKEHLKANALLSELKTLDKSPFMPNDGKYGIVGILEDIKQACEIELVENTDTIEQTESEIESILAAMKLEFLKKSGEMKGFPGQSWVQFFVSQSQETAARLKTLFETTTESQEEWIECEREKGKILGYPETATEYYIDRELNGNEDENPNSANDKYHSYIHSPEHAEEEYLQYEAKLDAAFRKYCPTSAKELLGE